MRLSSVKETRTDIGSQVSFSGFVVPERMYTDAEESEFSRRTLVWLMLRSSSKRYIVDEAWDSATLTHGLYFRSFTGERVNHSWPSRAQYCRRNRFSVPHDRLFLDALERDLKREKMGTEPTTVIMGEPARSFR